MSESISATFSGAVATGGVADWMTGEASGAAVHARSAERLKRVIVRIGQTCDLEARIANPARLLGTGRMAGRVILPPMFTCAR